MFRQMRRFKQLLPIETCQQILATQKRSVLSLLGDDDYPYAVPISFVYHEGCLYFHSAVEGHKTDAIRKHDKASFCVIDQDEVHGEQYTTFFRSVIAFGRVSIIEDAGEKLAAARLLGNRYYPNHDEALQKEMEKGLHRMLMFCMRIEHLTGKESIELTKRNG